MHRFFMKEGKWLQSVVLLLALLGLVGCRGGGSQYGGVNPPKPFEFPTAPSIAPTNTTAQGRDPSIQSGVPKLQVGELLTVTFHDVPPNSLQSVEQRIREDGTIVLPFSVTVMAAGKTPGQLEDDIRSAYVPKLYLRLTPTVKAEERSFFVGGEVKVPGRVPYRDKMTILRAIQTAGDFTDFANRKKIELIRANGTQFVIDWYKAKDDSRLDLEVFPGDQIIVPKGWF